MGSLQTQVLVRQGLLSNLRGDQPSDALVSRSAFYIQFPKLVLNKVALENLDFKLQKPLQATNQEFLDQFQAF